MKSKHLLLLGVALCCLFTVVNSAFPQGTTFTYNGQLKEIATGQPANGSFDLRFILYTADAGGSQVGPVLTNAPLGVTNGLFTATLDFGAGIFDGSARWLEIAVRTNGSVGSYDVLSPRARLTPTPYAIYAGSAGVATAANSATSVPWSGLNGVPPGFADGTDNDTTYTAGAGLNLAGIEFSLNFAGNGLASTASRSDHTHPPGDATTLDGLDSTAFAGTAHTHSFSQITGGVADAQLSANVTLLDRATQSFTGVNTFSPATDITGLRVRQSTVGSPTADIFAVQSTDGSATHFRVNSSGQVSWSGTAIGVLSGNASSASAAPWGGLTGLPAGFADNVDNDTTYSAGSGLSLAGTQFNVNFAGTGTTNSSARSDHTHPQQGDATTLDGLDSTAFALLNSSPVFTGTVTAGGDLAGARLRIGSGHGLTGPSATIAGGQNNSAAGARAMVGGGENNQAENAYSTVGGGLSNTNNGAYAVIPGGRDNRVLGSYALAAGRRAKAVNNGAFVWADSQDADFASTGNNQFLIRALGGVGIGVNNPDAQLVVGGKIKIPVATYGPPANGVNGGEGDKLILWPGLVSTTPFSLGIDANTMWFGVPDVATAFKWYAGTTERMRLTTSGNVGIGTASPKQALHVAGDYYGHGHLYLYAYEGDGANGTAYVQARDDSNTSSIGMVLRTQSNGVVKDAITMSADGNTVTVRVLRVLGGADVAEPFPITGQEIPPGAVLVIDEEHPGQLKLSDQPYDTRVAGIVSGANGVNPGLTLSQQGLFEGGQNVALSGRVYALADASTGPIRPGDLLTTSASPGHAMKAADRDRAQGAILGKAMSGLKEGTGLVLVLVTLQ